MKNLNIKVNETPVRTSRNFNINDIELKNVDIPEEMLEFKNAYITNEVEVSSENISNLKYGIGEVFTRQVNEKANFRKNFLIKDNKEVLVEFKIDNENPILVDDISVITEEGVSSTIIIKYESTDDVKAYHNGKIFVKANKNSHLKVIILNLINTKSIQMLAVQNELEENAKVDYTIVDFGGNYSITNYYSNLIGKNSNNSLHTIYLGKDEQCFDLNYIGELRGKNANIDIEVQGALKDYAKKHFKGTIDFKQGCKKATGNENEYCMLLSNKAKSIALPMLLCTEEDVNR